MEQNVEVLLYNTFLFPHPVPLPMSNGKVWWFCLFVLDFKLYFYLQIARVILFYFILFFYFLFF